MSDQSGCLRKFSDRLEAENALLSLLTDPLKRDRDCMNPRFSRDDANHLRLHFLTTCDASWIKSNAFATGRIRAPESTEYWTTCSRNSGVHPYRLGWAATSWVAKISHPIFSRFLSIKFLIGSMRPWLCSRKKAESWFKSMVPAFKVCPPARQQEKCLAASRLVSGRGSLIGNESERNSTSGSICRNASWFLRTEFSKSILEESHEWRCPNV
jgi:hypothetical protein